MNPIRKDMELLSNSMATYAHITGIRAFNTNNSLLPRLINQAVKDRWLSTLFRFGLFLLNFVPRHTSDPKNKITTNSMNFSVQFDLASHI